MKHTCLALCAALLLTAALPVETRAADGFEWPNLNPLGLSLNPFESKSGKPRRKSTDDSWLPSSMNLLPNLPPLPFTSPRTSRGPSAWQKMNRNTKKLFEQSADFLMPWQADSPPPRTSATGTQRVYTLDGDEEDDSDSGWSLIPSIFGSKPEKKAYRDVNDFLDQPRVPY